MDEDWNPQITLQAEARAHRIGQTKKVTVYKLCTQGTVEEQMLGRIRKKLYLSARITESMRSNINAGGQDSKKRKRGAVSDAFDNDAPQLDTTSLKSLIRRGAQTLVRPEIDVTQMLDWDWETTLEKCKDQAMDAQDQNDKEDDETAEDTWLNTMTKVETAVFDGKKHQREIDREVADTTELDRTDRRIGKNTTVMVDGFAINKESMACGDWEAVPTFAGKDPRLAEPEKMKKAAIQHQDFCQACWTDGEVVVCSGCPRSYHISCLEKPFQARANSKLQFYCPQHECVDCQSKTAEAGGMIYRCRWCENGYCEDCLDWSNVKLVGDTLPEYEMLSYEGKSNAWYIECPPCLKHLGEDARDRRFVEKQRKRVQEEYAEFLAAMDDGEGTAGPTPATVSEVGTPGAVEMIKPAQKKRKIF